VSVVALIIAGVVLLMAISARVPSLFTSEPPRQTTGDRSSTGTAQHRTEAPPVSDYASTGDTRGKPSNSKNSLLPDPQHQSQVTDHSSSVARFRSKLFEFEYASQLFAGIEPGVTSGVIKIEVTNFWFEFKPHQKRQLTTMITNMWHQEAGTGSVIVHIYDQTGHEVAGTRALGGVWIEEE
jgi:hypothetical protein